MHILTLLLLLKLLQKKMYLLVLGQLLTLSCPLLVRRRESVLGSLAVPGIGIQLKLRELVCNQKLLLLRVVSKLLANYSLVAVSQLSLKELLQLS